MSVGAVNKSTGDRIPTAGMPAIDVALSGSSTNPVQNRVVKAALDEKADTDIVASDFDATASYTAGNYCIYEGKFYRFKTTHSGAWVAADVDEIKIAGELSALKSGLTSVMSNVTFIPQATPGNNPFDTDGTGYVLKVMFGSTHLGYMTIRPKGFVDANNRPIAIELFTPTWGLAWQVLRDNS